jgi:hypothetical protein
MRQVIRPPPPPGAWRPARYRRGTSSEPNSALRSTSSRAWDSNGRSQQGVRVQVQELLPGPSVSASIGGAASSR